MVTIKLEEAFKFIPLCTGEDDIYPFINACDMAVNLVEEKFAPTLVKYITTRLSGRALEIIKYKNVTKWSYLTDAFEDTTTATSLQIQLNSIKMCNDEDINDYYNSPIRRIVKARNHKTLEVAKQLSKAEEVEYKSDRDNNYRYRNDFSNNRDNYNTNNHIRIRNKLRNKTELVKSSEVNVRKFKISMNDDLQWEKIRSMLSMCERRVHGRRESNHIKAVSRFLTRRNSLDGKKLYIVSIYEYSHIFVLIGIRAGNRFSEPCPSMMSSRMLRFPNLGCGSVTLPFSSRNAPKTEPGYKIVRDVTTCSIFNVPIYNKLKLRQIKFQIKMLFHHQIM
ncbi:myb-like protein D [Aphis craccivora]|uniref:Myb-like protein D n=1 Tax=Aphis craccivora TaxID=307492 RepID=A0A6G0W9T0_APHCR|nr:myb-like protein D [Aphis craccivora]